MKKTIILGFVVLGLIIVGGCTIVKQQKEIVNVNALTYEECKDVPDFWYGDKGVDPSENNLWRCYDWELNGL